MNTTQIKYFLTAAKTLNFTQAAKQLYISQPALSKQIVALEKELNMMLFIREKNKVRLTPAGLVLLRELPAFEQHYESIIQTAKIINEGNAGELTIGILEGQMLGQEFTNLLAGFSVRYPNISLRLLRNSFSELREQMNDESIDLAITLDFDVKHRPEFTYEIIMENPALAAISKNHPLAKRPPQSFADLKDQTIIAISEKDSVAAPALIISDCNKAGFHPIIKYANSLETAMLWIEAGIGIGIINSMNNLVMNPNIVILDQLPLEATYSVLAWKKDNINPTISLFISYMKEHMR